MNKIALKACAVFLILILTGLNGIAQKNIFKYADNEFISDWLICGPFPSDNGKSIDTDFLKEGGGEDNLNQDFTISHASESDPSGEVSWQPAVADKSGRLNFVKYLSPSHKNVTYAAAYIECEQITPAILKMGSNDRLKMWLNGKLVHVHSQPRAGGPDTDQVPVELKKGKNLLLAKVDNEGGNWWLYARFEKLLPVDGEIFMTPPLVSAVPQKTSTGVADIFNIMLFNISDKPVSPVDLRVRKDRARPEINVKSDVIGAKEYRWVSLESPVDIEKAKGRLSADLVISTASGSKTINIRTERKDIMDGNMFLVQGFHVDPVWRDSQAGYQALSFSNLSQYLYALQGDSAFGLYLHEIPYLKPYYDSHPGEREMIRRFVKEGRIETGGTYNQPNETTISGEAFIRNILYGRLFHENVLGDYPRVYTPWDVFGHIIQLPQILAKSEFIGTTWERGNYRSPFVRVPDVPDLYWSMSPDGSIILNRKVAYGFPGRESGQYKDLDLQTRKLMADMLTEQQEQIPGIQSDFMLNATDEKSPTGWIIGRSREFETYIPKVNVDADGAEKYFNSVMAQAADEKLDIPVVSRDESQYNEGCELSRFDLKMGNRLAENMLISAEKFSTIANIMGYEYPAADLDKAWRQLLYGQHHDGITGCGADVPYLDLVEAYHEALELGGEALEHSIRYISEMVNTDVVEGIPLVVFNPLNWERKDIVRKKIVFKEGQKGFRIVDENGEEVPSAVERTERENGKIVSAEASFIASGVPSVGYKTYWAVPSDNLPGGFKSSPVKSNLLENSYYKLEVDEKAGGGITSLIEKSTGKEFIKSKTGHPGNELIRLKEGAGFEPAWRFITTGEKIFSKDKSAEIEIFENKICKKIVVTGEMDRMKKRIQEIVMYNDIERIDFKTYLVDYEGLGGKNIREDDDRPRRNDRDFYCIGFPADLDGAVPVLEDRFATKTYYHSKGNFEYHSTNTEWTSHHSMNSCNNWIDYSQSVKVDFGDKGSIALGPAEILTPKDPDLRHSGFALIGELAKRGITATPSFDTVERDYDIQFRRFSFSIGVEGKNEYNEKLLGRLTKEQLKRYKKELREKGYAYIFVYDSGLKESWFNLPVLIISGVNKESTLTAVGKIVEELRKHPLISFSEEVCTGNIENSVPDCGLAILNKGNMPVSVERDGTMVMALMHTVPWQSPLLKWTHDFPERKTHLFEYSVIPHGGNWREAKLVQAGYEFNNPLVAVQAHAHDGDMPHKKSFFSIEGGNAVITALKPKSGGNEAFLGNTPTDAKNGVILRLYETHGEPSELMVLSDFKLKNAEKVNLIERNPEKLSASPNSFQMGAGANSIETVLLSYDVEEISKKRDVTGNDEIYAQYWHHNKGAAPTGYLPVTVKVLGDLSSFTESKSRLSVQQVKVAVCNNYTDTPVSGELKIETPPGLRAVPSELEYSVKANSEEFFPVAIVLEGSGSEPGFIKASVEGEEGTVFDVLEYNMPERLFGHSAGGYAGNIGLEWEIISNDKSFEVMIKNPFAQNVSGEISIIGPVESWGNGNDNPLGIIDVSPWRQRFDIAANGSVKLNFTLSNVGDLGEDDISSWLVAKLSCFGYVDYKKVIGDLDIKD